MQEKGELLSNHSEEDQNKNNKEVIGKTDKEGFNTN